MCAFGCALVLGLLLSPARADYESLTLSGKDWYHSVGGLLQWDSEKTEDFLFLSKLGLYPTQDDIIRSQIRRSRLELSGSPFPDWYYRLQWQFNNKATTTEIAETRLRDGWLRFKAESAPVYLQLGQMREPLGLLHQTPSAYLVTLERSLEDSLFYPRRSRGIALGGYGSNRAITHFNWKVGAFDNGYHPDADGGANITATGRMTIAWGLVHGDLKTRQRSRDIFHLGLFGSYREADDSIDFVERYLTDFQFNLNQRRPVLYQSGVLLDEYRIDNQRLLGLEAAVAYGSWYAHTELLFTEHESANEDIDDDYNPETSFVEAGWLFSGDHRPYDVIGARFGRMVPEKHTGAWIIYFRWNDADLRDNGFGMGMDMKEAGINWYLNELVAIKANWRQISTNKAIFPKECPEPTTEVDCEYDRNADAYSLRIQADF